MAKLHNFILEIVFDMSFFEKDDLGKKRFRFREESQFFHFKAKDEKSAPKVARRLFQKKKDQIDTAAIGDWYIYKRIEGEFKIK